MSLIDTFALLDEPELHIPGGIVVTRATYTTAQDPYGDFVAGLSLVFVIDPAMVHPIKDGRDRLQLPEADRQADAIKVYTRARLYCDSTYQDSVAWQGRAWSVVSVEDYGPQGGGFVSVARLQEAT